MNAYRPQKNLRTFLLRRLFWPKRLQYRIRNSEVIDVTLLSLISSWNLIAWICLTEHFLSATVVSRCEQLLLCKVAHNHILIVSYLLETCILNIIPFFAKIFLLRFYSFSPQVFSRGTLISICNYTGFPIRLDYNGFWPSSSNKWMK